MPKSLVLQNKCNIEIFLSPAISFYLVIQKLKSDTQLQYMYFSDKCYTTNLTSLFQFYKNNLFIDLNITISGYTVNPV